VLSSGSLNEALTNEDSALATVKEALSTTAKPGNYRTAFFEAFPTLPPEHQGRFYHNGHKLEGVLESRLFIRGEGATVEEAETKCWEQWQRILSCERHDLDRRKRLDGYCFCEHCGMGGSWLQPLTLCFVCGTPNNYCFDKDGVCYCEAHKGSIPKDKRPRYMDDLDELLAEKEKKSA
jgi:hypothetical protein